MRNGVPCPKIEASVSALSMSFPPSFRPDSFRFVPRFVLHQKSKDRMIDDTKRGGQNEQANFVETIFTASVDFIGEWQACRAQEQTVVSNQGSKPSHISFVP